MTSFASFATPSHRDLNHTMMDFPVACTRGCSREDRSGGRHAAGEDRSCLLNKIGRVGTTSRDTAGTAVRFAHQLLQ
eukprot:79753-Pelagomonas_calceolata.AAC.2